MTRPFQYDNFVQSQIGIGTGNSYANIPGNSQSFRQTEGRNGSQGRNELKQKINELLGLCQDENQGVKSQFAQVMGAEKEILDLMKEEFDQPPRFNNYARSNVEMFPGTSQGVSVAPTGGYQGEPRQRSYQSFPLERSGQHGHPHPHLGPHHQPHPHHQGFDTGSYQQQNFGGQGFPQGYGSSHSGFGSHQGTYPQHVTAPGQSQGQAGYYQQGYGQGGQGAQYDDGYGTQYVPSNQLISQDGFGYASGHQPSGRATILKSKVQQLKQENSRLKNLASQGQIPLDDDPETRQLQQEIARLRAVVQDYEHQLSSLNAGNQSASKAHLLRQLKDQGEKIRQDTISLLRNKSTPNAGFSTGGAGNYYGAANYGTGYSVAPTNYGPAGGYGASQIASTGARGGLHPDQQAQLRAQLNELRMECEQLHNESTNIKRVSKGTTQFTSGSRRF